MIIQAMPYPKRAQTGLTNDVRLLMLFEGSDGATSFTDTSTYARTVTTVGTAQVDTALAVEGSASLLLASGDQLTVPDSTDFDLGTEPFTISAWIRPTAGGNRHIIGQRPNTTEYWFLVANNSGRVEFQAYTDGTAFDLRGGAISDAGVWQSCIVSRNASGKVRLRLNGLVVDSETGNTSSIQGVTGLLTIGKSQGSFALAGFLPFVGSIDLAFVIVGVDLFDTDDAITPPTSLPMTGPEFSASPMIASANGFFGEGDTLTVTVGTFTPTELATITYQWRRDGAAISGATGTSYVLVSDDIGTMITVTQTATNFNGSASRTSAAVGPVVTPSFRTDTRIAGTNTRIAGTDTRTIQTRIA